MSLLAGVRKLLISLLRLSSGVFLFFQGGGKRSKVTLAIEFFTCLLIIPSSGLAQITNPINMGRVTVGASAVTSPQELCAPTGVLQTVGSSAPSITGTDGNDFSVPVSGCANAFLNGFYECGALYADGIVHNGCPFTVSFEPTTYGIRTAAVTFSINSGNQSLPIQGTGGIILRPAAGAKFPITQPGNKGPFETSNPVPFRAVGVTSGQTVSWKTILTYQTSGGVPIPAATASPNVTFPTTGTETTYQTYTSQGGHLTVHATVGSFTDSVVAYIVGPLAPAPDIPAIDITNQLTTLYKSVTFATNPLDPYKLAFKPATLGLMTQVVQLESSYRQFTSNTVYQTAAFWPRESPQTTDKYGNITSRTGAHIGLTQLPVNMPDAWDWLLNTQDGVNLFTSKLSIAYNTFAVPFEISHPGLPGITPCQLEEMALALYGPFAGGTDPKKYPKQLNQQYYTIHCNGGTGTACTNGSWQWILNPAAPKTKPYCSLCYVSDIRSRIPPTGGSVSSCPTIPSIPLDPLYTTANSIKLCKAKCPAA